MTKGRATSRRHPPQPPSSSRVPPIPPIPHALASASPVPRAACDPASGRAFQLFSDAPGMVMYTGNFLDGSVVGKGGAAYQKRSGFCLETQHHPNAVNVPAFPSPVLQPGDTYSHTMVYDFYVR